METEWSLNQSVAKAVFASLAEPVIDLFATATRSFATVGRPSVVPEPRNVQTHGMETEREQLRQAGLSDKVIDTIQSDVRVSTKEVYGRQWELFGNWCSQQGVDPCNSSVGEICSFFAASP